MRYIGKCKRCNYIVSKTDVTLFKDAMVEHMEKSHKIDYDIIEISSITLKDFEDFFTITRVKDRWIAEQLKIAFLSNVFWKAYRKGV
jgi:hypothetical protein